jgi:hypothetical protein
MLLLLLLLPPLPLAQRMTGVTECRAVQPRVSLVHGLSTPHAAEELNLGHLHHQHLLHVITCPHSSQLGEDRPEGQSSRANIVKQIVGR